MHPGRDLGAVAGNRVSGDGWADSVEVTGCETILGRRVLLVDEVAPVGESLEWAARALRDAGAAQVLIT